MGPSVSFSIVLGLTSRSMLSLFTERTRLTLFAAILIILWFVHHVISSFLVDDSCSPSSKTGDHNCSSNTGWTEDHGNTGDAPRSDL